MTEARSSTAQRVLVVLGIVVLAFNLRPTAVSVGPVLGDISAGLRMSTAETWILTSLPVLAFAVFGALAPREREIVRLRFAEGLTQREIAAAMSLSQMHVSRLIRRSVDMLRSSLEPRAEAA